MNARILLGILCLSLLAWNVGAVEPDATTEPKVDEVEIAYQEIRTGQLYDATIRLINLMRNMPTDSAAQAHEFLEPAHLLAFTVAFLLDWPERIELLNEVVNEDVYEADRLGIAGNNRDSHLYSLVSAFQCDKMQRCQE